jgi:hypothetical protein
MVIVSYPFVFVPFNLIHLFDGLKAIVSVNVSAVSVAAPARESEVAPSVPVVVPVPVDALAEPTLIVV